MNREKLVSLHSRYNPSGEAERYINSLSLNEKTRFFILIEPGRGYMVAPLKKKAPGAKIISLHIKTPTFEKSDNNAAEMAAPDSLWYPETGIPVQDFLEAEIADSIASHIKVLEWRPALAVYGKAYLSLMEETANFIKRSDANARTIIAFGSRWFKNFFLNLELIKFTLCPIARNSYPVSRPLLVTGAGPGLEDAIPIVIKDSFRKSVFILAAASSQAALEAKGLRPDMLISIDGSQWAKFHLYNFLRNQSEACCLAASITAALPSQCKALPVLVLSDGSLWQTHVLKGMKIPFYILPQRGTVAATALDLAFNLTKDDIYIAGIDFENRDIRSHARPYSFDRFIEKKAGRMNPLYSQVYKRSSLLKAGGSYDVYASWFQKQLALYPRRLHPLGSNNPLFGAAENNAMLPKAVPETRAMETEELVSFKTIPLSFDGSPSQKACAILEAALQDPLHQAVLEKELSSLLFQGKTAVCADELISAIRPLAGISSGKSHG